MIYILTASFILFDMITGLTNAVKNKMYDSSVMREGLFHKIGSVLCVAFGVLVDYAQLYIELEATVPVALAVCGYIIVMEIGSIIENICSINPEIMPNKLKSYFFKLTDKEE